MAHDKKLYRLTSGDFQFPWALSGDRVIHKLGKDIPQLVWPDGSSCWLANQYLLNGFKKGRSRRNNGGTLLTWAKHLTHLIRWCYDRQRDFFDLDDTDFVEFISFLTEERTPNAPDIKARSSKQVSRIAGTVMHFLAFIDTLMPGLNLIGTDGRVKAELKSVDVKRHGRKIKLMAWKHQCLPKNNPDRRRQPISTQAIERLHDANNASNAPAHVVRRRFIMLRLFELTGGRRIEVSLIKVQDLLDAEATGQLRIFSAKQRDDDAFRYVPVTKADLKEILSFVKHYRHLTIKRTIGVAKDHGYLFVGINTGKPLEIGTLNSELSALRKAAGIEDEEACLHAFRHRYITNVLRTLIRMHRCKNASDLKKALLSTEAMKHQLTEWTGHSSLDALEHYVHLAFEAETGFKETLDILQAGKVIESLHFIVKDYRNQAQAMGWTPKLFIEFETAVATAELELSQLIKPNQMAEA